MEQRIPIAELACEQLRQEVGAPESLSEMEQAIRAFLLWLGRIVLEGWLRTLEQAQPARQVVCRCGGVACYWGRRAGTLRTLFGQVQYRRAYYTCSTCGEGHCPLDRQLGLRPNAMSAEMECLAGWSAWSAPSGKAVVYSRR